MSEEYKPLHEHFPLKEGTVLEAEGLNADAYVWLGDHMAFCATTGRYKVDWNPFNRKWRIVSTPPKRLEFEVCVRCDEAGTDCIYLPKDHGLPYGDTLRVTVEEIR